MRRFALSVLALAAVLAALPAFAGAAPSAAGQEHAAAALEHAKDLMRGAGVHTGRELTPALLTLQRERGGLDPAGRKQAVSLLARPTDSEASPGHAYSVPEAKPWCTLHFCIHYVRTTVDAPDQTDANRNGVPDYVERMANVFENEVFPCENGSAPLGCSFAGSAGLGWPQAPSDGTLGGDSRFDVYVEDLYPSGVYGYVSPDPSQTSSSSYASYLVMDKDFSRYSATIPALDEMRVTAAHEYNHVLQFGIDPNEDVWMFESTATFFENEVYPAIDDYLGYMPDWVDLTAQPLTADPGDDPNTGGVREDLKIYGSAVWNHFIAARHGARTILDAWQAKTQVGGGSFAPASYSTAIAADGGTSFSDEFEDFSAAVAEWGAPGSGFPDVYPDVPAAARPNLSVGAAATSMTLDHATFAFRNVAPPSTSIPLTLTATLPTGLKGAIALVGRTGSSSTAGAVTRVVSRAASGGPLSVTLPSAGSYGRITAIFVNADPSQNGWSRTRDDWKFTKDGQSFSGIQVVAGAASAPATATTTAAPAAATTQPATPSASATDVPSADTTSTSPAPAPVDPAAGSTAPAPSTGDGSAAGPSGTATALVAPLHLTLRVTRARLARVLAKGLSVRAACAPGCTVRLKLALASRLARGLHLKTIVLARRVHAASSGSIRVTLKLTRRERARLSRLRRVPLTVVATASDRDGRRAAASKRLTIKR